MTEFVLGSYRLEVDVEATRAWYGRYGNATGGCGCAYCRNYAAAVGVLPPEAAAFLEPLGLNLRRPGDIGEYENRLLYLGAQNRTRTCMPLDTRT